MKYFWLLAFVSVIYLLLLVDAKARWRGKDAHQPPKQKRLIMSTIVAGVAVALCLAVYYLFTYMYRMF